MMAVPVRKELKAFIFQAASCARNAADFSSDALSVKELRRAEQPPDFPGSVNDFSARRKIMHMHIVQTEEKTLFSFAVCMEKR